MRKRRSDSKLHHLPEATQRAIFAYSQKPGVSIEMVCAALSMPECEGTDEHPAFGVGSVSAGAVSGFLRELRTAAWRDRLQAAAQTADDVEGELTVEDRARIEQATLDGLREILLDSVVSGSLDHKAIKGLYGLILSERKQSLDERKVAILERKAAAFDKISEDVEDDNLTPEQRLAKIREGLKI